MPIRHKKKLCTAFSRTQEEVKLAHVERELNSTKSELEVLKEQMKLLLENANKD